MPRMLDITTMAMSLVVVLGLSIINPAVSVCTMDKLTPTLNRTDGTPTGILKLLHEGERLLNLQEEDHELVAFMGITGSGKTTFVLHIAGNDDDLTSVETRPRSGEYIIDDKCNRSSSAAKTIESFTLVPDRFVDTETKTTYIDMPGFSDTRPLLAYDIAATYFSKQVLDHARRIKLVFIVNHSHMKAGEDRGRFTELVDHITTLIQDVPKFKDSIALIASKVSNVFDPSGRPVDFPFVPDEEVVEGIADFLKDAKSFYLEDNRTKAAELMDIFLEKENNSFVRIGLFRRPDGPGPLSNVTSIQRNKRQLRAIINSNIHFTEKNIDDFGYTLSEKSKNMLLTLKEGVLRNATDTIRALGETMEGHFIEQETSTDDLDEMISIYNDSPTEAATLTRMVDFTNYMETFAARLGVNISASRTRDLKDNERIMDFLIKMRGEGAIDWASTIRNGTSEMTDFLRHSKAWYILFLNTMYDTLSGYNVQNSSYGTLIPLLEEIYQHRRTSTKISLTKLITLKPFLNEIGHAALLRIYESFGPISVNERKLFFLEKVLNTTLNSGLDQISCVDGTLTAQGRYVLLNHVVNELQKCPPGLRFIEILALEKIFIDSSLNLAGRGIEVSMIAPVLVTVGQVEITLDGTAGKEYRTVAWGTTTNGAHGDPGLPGGSAGHFIGIGADLIDSDQLTISARGGTGGTGQQGGDGYQGADGEEAQSYSGRVSEWSMHHRWSGHEIDVMSGYSSGFWRSFGYVLGVAKDRQVYQVKVYAYPGKNGGDGGDGGVGGDGGYRGQIVVIDFNNGCRNSSAKTIASDGNKGRAGKGGKGAPGGRAGRTLVEILTVQTYWWSDEERELHFEGYIRPRDWDRARDGFDGTAGAMKFRKRSPTRIPFSEPDTAISHFKAFARSHLIPSSLRKNALKKMLQRLDAVGTTTSGSSDGSPHQSFEKKWQACCSSNCDRLQK